MWFFIAFLAISWHSKVNFCFQCGWEVTWFFCCISRYFMTFLGKIQFWLQTRGCMILLIAFLAISWHSKVKFSSISWEWRYPLLIGISNSIEIVLIGNHKGRVGLVHPGCTQNQTQIEQIDDTVTQVITTRVDLTADKNEGTSWANCPTQALAPSR